MGFVQRNDRAVRFDVDRRASRRGDDRGSVARPEGLEPPAYRFEACRSIQLSYGRSQRLSVADRFARGKARHAPIAARGRRSEPPCYTFGFAPVPFSRAISGADPPGGPVAQLAEQQTLNLRVVGSIPTRLTRFSFGFLKS